MGDRVEGGKGAGSSGKSGLEMISVQCVRGAARGVRTWGGEGEVPSVN